MSAGVSLCAGRLSSTYELGLDTDPARHPDVVAMQAREANIEGAG
jgi:pilus assembly protein CpaF